MARVTPYPLRMPEELRQQLEQQAERNNKSLNAEIVARLRHSFTDIDEDQAKANAYELAQFKDNTKTAYKALHELVNSMNKDKQ